MRATGPWQHAANGPGPRFLDGRLRRPRPARSAGGEGLLRRTPFGVDRTGAPCLGGRGVVVRPALGGQLASGVARCAAVTSRRTSAPFDASARRGARLEHRPPAASSLPPRRAVPATSATGPNSGRTSGKGCRRTPLNGRRPRCRPRHRGSERHHKSTLDRQDDFPRTKVLNSGVHRLFRCRSTPDSIKHSRRNRRCPCATPTGPTPARWAGSSKWRTRRVRRGRLSCPGAGALVRGRRPAAQRTALW